MNKLWLPTTIVLTLDLWCHSRFDTIPGSGNSAHISNLCLVLQPDKRTDGFTGKLNQIYGFLSSSTNYRSDCWPAGHVVSYQPQHKWTTLLWAECCWPRPMTTTLVEKCLKSWAGASVEWIYFCETLRFFCGDHYMSGGSGVVRGRFYCSTADRSSK